MARTTFFRYFLKLSTCFLSALVFVFLTLSLGYARLDSPKDKKDGSEKPDVKILRHIEKMEEEFPEIRGKKKEIEEELTSGVLAPSEACTHCHTPGQGGP